MIGRVLVVGVGACDQEMNIGFQGRMPWHFPEDLKHFRNMTVGSPIVMGKKTWDGLGRFPLPGRLNIILSRRENPGWRDSCLYTTYEELLMGVMPALDGFVHRLMIIGGAEIYELFSGSYDEFHLTRVDVARPRGDVKLPGSVLSGMALSAGNLELSKRCFVELYKRSN